MYILSSGMKACENYSRNGPPKHLVASFNNSETRKKFFRARKGNLRAGGASHAANYGPAVGPQAPHHSLGEKTRNGRAPDGTRPFILTPIARRQP
jgi:hypothetical protein